MTENDPRQSFLKDQEEAEQEQATRDQQSWSLNLRNGEAQAAQAEGVGAYWQAKAAFWTALTGLTHILGTLAVIAAVVLAVVLIVGVFR